MNDILEKIKKNEKITGVFIMVLVVVVFDWLIIENNLPNYYLKIDHELSVYFGIIPMVLFLVFLYFLPAILSALIYYIIFKKIGRSVLILVFTEIIWIYLIGEWVKHLREKIYY